MRLFMKTRSAEVETAVALFIVGWIGGMSGGFLKMDPLLPRVFAIALMVGGVLLLFHASYSRQLFNLRFTEVKAAVALFAAGWIWVMVGGFCHSLDWISLVLAHGLIAGGMFLLLHASYEKAEPA